MILRRMFFLTSGFCLLLALPAARAQEVLDHATAGELVDALNPGFSETRGLLVEASPVSTNSYGDTLAATVNLAIHFDFNSADISLQSEALLKSLGEALASPALSQYRFLIGGHTDAVGSDAFNMELSRERAEATRNFLVSRYGIASDRLVTRAFGKSALLLPGQPQDGRNRRVEISTLQ